MKIYLDKKPPEGAGTCGSGTHTYETILGFARIGLVRWNWSSCGKSNKFYELHITSNTSLQEAISIITGKAFGIEEEPKDICNKLIQEAFIKHSDQMIKMISSFAFEAGQKDIRSTLQKALGIC